MPSSDYKPFYIGFWIKHRILHLLVTSVMEKPKLEYEEFVESLKVTSYSPEVVSVTLQMLGRSLTEEDLCDDDVVSRHVTWILDFPCTFVEIIPPRNVRRAP